VQKKSDPDVIVVGAGNAGLCAALTAHEAGARVLVIEAAPEAERGGNSRFAGAIFRVVHGGLDDLVDLIIDESAVWKDRVTVDPYTPDDYHEDLRHASNGRMPQVLADRLVNESYETAKWMKDQGVKWELSVGKHIDPATLAAGQKYTVQPGEALRTHHEGIGLTDNLFEAVERAGIEIWYSSPVVDLVMNGSTCTGVVIRHPDGDVVVSGQVVLAAGGFEANAQARQKWLGPGWDLVKVRGTRFNTGTVLEAAMRAGARPVGHWGGCHAVPIDNDAPAVGELALKDKTSRYSYIYGLLLNSDAQRFLDEGENEIALTYAKTGAAIRGQHGGWAVQIFDAKTTSYLEPRYSSGTPVVADTLEELAGKVGLDAERLLETVGTFNKACSGEPFDPFVKDGLKARPDGQPVKSNWAQPIDTAPYTAYAVTCGITFTYGGIEVDENAGVVDIAGRTMPGLFATGELTGNFFFHNYPAGAGLMRGAIYGRIAGASAARAAAAKC
jgi:tricarballylate dehydrogenase